ncbi:MATE family efflux transporter [Tenacibaculum jejuense]|uniref:Polysaccharide biosynthesis protein C-terminal domain-containing protein n=1 Tax=Tenacibaculum jejuense TaxID=584609 RepID=A0A238UD61_9FLAO|nr:hypothetical protein [Tenacibaculum jejuense]SNR17109.1 Probable transmembrane protein of unknown function [Tenacibaculum jejuense]
MKKFINYIKDFFNRSGGFVLGATIIARGLSFVTSWIALQLISKKALGEVLYAWNIITFILPLVGLGLHQSYIRYGALLKSKKDKEQLLFYVLKRGVLISLIMSFFVAIFGFSFDFSIDNSGRYLAIFSLIFVPFFLFEILKIKTRLLHKNKKHAFIDISYSLIMVTLVTILSFTFQEIGYIIALLLSPSICVAFYFKEFKGVLQLLTRPKLNIIDIRFWKYGVFGGLSNVATILLFAIDILLIGNILQEPEKVTVYRYISLLPFSILFLPRAFITTDFVTLTEKINNTTFIKNYCINYCKLFLVISIIYISFFYAFDDFFLNLLDTSFVDYKESFLILNIGICGILILRGLFGNLLSSLGLVQVNFYITLAALLINYFANQKLIPEYGIKGAAITSASLQWFTGIASFIFFLIYYKRKSSIS